MLLLDEEKARPVEERDLRWIAGAETLSSEQPVMRSQYDPVLGGTIDMQFGATK